MLLYSSIRRFVKIEKKRGGIVELVPRSQLFIRLFKQGRLLRIDIGRGFETFITRGQSLVLILMFALLAPNIKSYDMILNLHNRPVLYYKNKDWPMRRPVRHLIKFRKLSENLRESSRPNDPSGRADTGSADSCYVRSGVQHSGPGRLRDAAEASES